MTSRQFTLTITFAPPEGIDPVVTAYSAVEQLAAWDDPDRLLGDFSWTVRPTDAKRWLLLIEHPDGVDVTTPDGSEPEVVRFDWYYFGKEATADDMLGYLRLKLAQLADSSNGWPQTIRDDVRELLREAVDQVDLFDGDQEYEVDWDRLALRQVTL